MKILLLAPFYGGSHKQWVDGFMEYTSHEVELLKLSGHHWKWRMHGAAVTLAHRFLAMDFQPDLILASDMMDLSVFMALCSRKLNGVKTAIYFHENQLTYPWSNKDRDFQRGRNNHYSFINYTSALAANAVFFNSEYHKNSFITALPEFLSQFPDHTNPLTVSMISGKSKVLHLGMDLSSLDEVQSKEVTKPKRAVILWNHRWEYDKDPDTFFQALFELQDRGIEFKLVVLGEELDKNPAIFEVAKKRLALNIIHWGFCEDSSEYAKWLWMADILPVTSNQDFFGGSVIEAVYCNTIPLLPKRLAYPEHFPEPWQQRQFFYEDEQDFVNRLQRNCMDVRLLRNQQTQKLVQHYDWKVCIKGYDDKLERV